MPCSSNVRSIPHRVPVTRPWMGRASSRNDIDTDSGYPPPPLWLLRLLSSALKGTWLLRHRESKPAETQKMLAESSGATCLLLALGASR